ncbi:MAG: carboxylesterase family protein [Pseudomonadota bacterium]
MLPQRLALLFTLLVSLIGCTKSDDAAQQSPDLIVNAAGEQLRGEALTSNVIVFRGVPYALAPVGPRRWTPPQPPSPRRGVQDAIAFGPACPQDQGNPNWYRDVAKHFGADQSVIPMLREISEDCLFLNIWTANLNGEPPKPVMVWIHGGSNVNGYAHEPNYLGHRLAESGVVLVSINYRLGPLGFLAHPGLSAEDANGVSGFYGLADQIASLKWIKTNIASFGGDPENITVFGESAGGGNISALTRMPTAKGLFDKAIIQSGALSPHDAINEDEALAYGMDFSAGLGADTVDAMRAIPWEELVRIRSERFNDYYFYPVTDGHYLPSDAPIEKVKLLIGANQDEWLMYLPDDASSTYTGALSDYFGSAAEEMARYLEPTFDTDARRANYLISAAEFFCPSLDLANKFVAEGNPTYVYYFTRVRPNGEDILAYHGAEIPYVFDTADDWLPADDIDPRLTEAMVRYWTNFARIGDPNGAGLPYWAQYNAEEGAIMELGDDIGPAANAPKTICAALRNN